VLASLAVALMHPLALRAGLTAIQRADGPPHLLAAAVAWWQRIGVDAIASMQMWLSVFAVAASITWLMPSLGVISMFFFLPLTALVLLVAATVTLPITWLLYRTAQSVAGDDQVQERLPTGALKRTARTRNIVESLAASVRNSLHWVDPAKLATERIRVLRHGMQPTFVVTLFFVAVLVCQAFSISVVFGAWSSLVSLGDGNWRQFWGDVEKQYAFMMSELHRFQWQHVRVPWPFDLDAMASMLRNPSRFFAPIGRLVGDVIEARQAWMTLGIVLGGAKFVLMKGLALSASVCKLDSEYNEVKLSDLSRRLEGSEHVQPGAVLDQRDIIFRCVTLSAACMCL